MTLATPQVRPAATDLIYGKPGPVALVDLSEGSIQNDLDVAALRDGLRRMDAPE